MKKILSLLLLSSSLFSMQLDIVRVEQKAATVKSLLNKTHIEQKSVFVPNRLGQVELFHDKKGFCVYKDDEKYRIQKYHVDKMVRDMSKEQLQAFLAVGYVTLNQMDNGDYSLKAQGRINGGGPLLGTAMYWITKSLCYAIPVAAVTATVAVTGGAVVAAAGGTAAVAGGGAAAVAATSSVAGSAVTAAAGLTTAGVTVGTTAGTVAVGAATTTAVGITAGAAGAAIAAAGAGTEATLITASAVASADGVAGVVVGIEAVSMAVGTFFGMLPTP